MRRLPTVGLILGLLGSYTVGVTEGGHSAPCDKPVGDCQWYEQCLQARYPTCTGASSYALSFGMRFCERFKENFNNFSPAGQEWLTKVGPCLQYAMLPYMESNSSMTCDEVKKAAFETHAPCYVSCGFCGTSFGDYFRVLQTITPALSSEFGEILRGLLKVLWQCVTGGNDIVNQHGVCYGGNSSGSG